MNATWGDRFVELAFKQSSKTGAQALQAGAVALDKLRIVRHAFKHLRRVLAERGNGFVTDLHWLTARAAC
jgi:hypothetical protein